MVENRTPERRREPRSGVRLPLSALVIVLASFTAIGPGAGTGTAHAARAALPSCVYVSSYHPGYTWSDRIEQALRATLGERCHIVASYMDSKRRSDLPDLQAAAENAMQVIRATQPAVIIVSDDNAAKHLVVPYLKDSRVPVVFAGLNWTVEEYGFPWPNVTGIVEVSPIRAMFDQAMRIVPHPRRVAYLAANTPSEWKNFARVKKEAQALDLSVYAMLVDNMVQFEASFVTAQGLDFLILGGSAGIRDWDADKARLITRRNSAVLSLTTRDWMMPYAMLGLTKLPEEQGEWAGASAIAILDGRSPATIPLATNRHWESWVNTELVELGGFELPKRLVRRARQVASR